MAFPSLEKSLDKVSNRYLLVVLAAKRRLGLVDVLLGMEADGIAADTDHLDIIRVLLDKGANVNARTDKGFTALIAAANKGHMATDHDGELVYLTRLQGEPQLGLVANSETDRPRPRSGREIKLGMRRTSGPSSR